ncbi:MAG: diadenosine tetraphosphate (Ap4A) HIT family hydrolase [Oceanicoccus sp.]|jgi:diadenosine tetraphosphate (Ap4A) HIT family hydrolase
MFNLHPQLSEDCFLVGDLPLCRVLLANDKNYPWLILVPRREGVREIFQLQASDQVLLMSESSSVARILNAHFNADKMNVAALGNMVPQLHLHHIVRYKIDVSWPKPVWGVEQAKIYSSEETTLWIKCFRELLLPLGLSH